jgi:hypothetical protein
VSYRAGFCLFVLLLSLSWAWSKKRWIVYACGLLRFDWRNPRVGPFVVSLPVLFLSLSDVPWWFHLGLVVQVWVLSCVRLHEAPVVVVPNLDGGRAQNRNDDCNEIEALHPAIFSTVGNVRGERRKRNQAQDEQARGGNLSDPSPMLLPFHWVTQAVGVQGDQQVCEQCEQRCDDGADNGSEDEGSCLHVADDSRGGA